MQLVLYPDKILMTQCQEAPDCGDKGRAGLAAEMWKIMDDNKGVGLAAPQVGLNIRMFVWKEGIYNFAIWNPKLSWVSRKTTSIEKCLSLPGVQVTIKRAIVATMFGTHALGFPVNRPRAIFRYVSAGISTEGDSTTTRIWQHEIDHLDGKLIIDNMSVENGTANKSALETLQKNTQT